MKLSKYLLSAILATVCSLVSFAGGDKNSSYAQATFPSQTCDLGYIKAEKGLVKCEFEVVNTGNAPLIIIEVKGSCGCTKIDFPKRPIDPGKKAKLKVTFNPAGLSGGFRKSITVKTNGREKRTSLYLDGSVIPQSKK